jgi:hypothetical protein
MSAGNHTFLRIQWLSEMKISLTWPDCGASKLLAAADGAHVGGGGSCIGGGGALCAGGGG